MKTASQTEVLAWLAEHHPELHAAAELDRDWVWLVWDGRGDQNKATRDAIKEFGFSFCFKGHALPSGKQGGWAHHCLKPIPFRRKGQKRDDNKNQDSIRTEDILAMIGA